jgi:putative salt-induced outer membrane protein YdiY
MRYHVHLLMLIIAILPATAHADEIVFKNGDRVKGKITQFLGDKLKVTGDVVGDVAFDLKEVSTFSTDEPLIIHFKDGSIFNKKIETGQEGMITLAAGQAGQPLTFNIADIDKVNPPPIQWTGNITAGIVVTRGNSHTQSANVSASAVRKSDIDRISADAGYNNTRQKDPDTGEVSTTQRSAYLGLQYDYFFNDKIYGYANARAERDAIADIDLRFLGGLGAGWQIYDTETFGLSAEAGVSWISENYYPPTDDEEYWSGRLAYHVNKDFNSAVSFLHNTVFYPGFEADGGYYAKSDAAIRSSLTDSMFAELKAIWSWDSTPAEDRERVDVTYLFSLGWSF